nr:hypothetical protein [Tanacetum cinerariifolium]
MDEDVEVNLQKAQATAYNLDLQHSERVLSMQDIDEEESVEVEEVLEVVTAVKLMTKVVTTAKPTTTVAQVQKASAPKRRSGVVIHDPEETASSVVTTAQPTTTAAQVPKPSAPRRRRGVVIQDPEETAASVIVHTENNEVMRYQALKRKPLTEARARKNMMIYLKNMAGFKMNFFKGMTYSEIRPLIEKYNNSIKAFLEKEEEEVIVQEKEIKEEGNKRQGESIEQEIAKKQRMDEEVEGLKRHLQIVANDDDDVYIEATPLASKVPVVDYQIHHENNKPYYKIIRVDGTHKLFLSIIALLKNFDREDLETLWKLVKERFESTEPKNFLDDFLLKILKIMFEKPVIEANVWRDQKRIYGLAKKYPLTHFTLEQMLNNVRLEVKEEMLLLIVTAAKEEIRRQHKVINVVGEDLVLPIKKSLLNQDSSIISSPKIDSLLNEFSGELAHINLIPSRINEADFDPEEEICLVEKLLTLNKKITMTGDDNHDGDQPKTSNPAQPIPPPTSQTHTISSIKLPILKKGEYDIQAMKMEHYLCYTDYPIWNGPVSVTTNTNGMIKVLPPRTVKEVVARERERKARTTLLIALPEDHLAKFHKMADAKEMFQTLLSQLEIHGAGVSHEDANQKFLKSLPSSWSQVALIMMTKLGLDTLSFDDLYSNLRVFKRDVKGTTASLSSNTQNVAFVSADNTSSTNTVSTAYSVSFPSVSKSQKEGSASYTDKVIHSLFTNQSSAPQLDCDDLERINDDDLEEMDLKWQVAMISIRIKKFHKRTGRKLQAKWNQDSRRRDGGYNGNKARDNSRRPAHQDDSKALVTMDGEDIDWSGHVEEDTQNFAMMAYSSSNLSSDNE